MPQQKEEVTLEGDMLLASVEGACVYEMFIGIFESFIKRIKCKSTAVT